MNVQLESLESLHADFRINASDEMDVLMFKSKIIHICSLLASYCFYCKGLFIQLQLKHIVNEISSISKSACKCKMINKTHLQDVVVCLEGIISLVKENEDIVNRNGIKPYSKIQS